MKCKVLTNFIDKYTGDIHKKGEFYECDKKRFNEIQAQGIFLKEEKQSYIFVFGNTFLVFSYVFCISDA